jgi:hypothetical protein
MADRTGSVADAARVVRFWQAVEIFSPQPLPKRDAGQRVADFQPGEPMPWEPGSRLGEEPIGLGLATGSRPSALTEQLCGAVAAKRGDVGNDAQVEGLRLD